LYIAIPYFLCNNIIVVLYYINIMKGGGFVLNTESQRKMKKFRIISLLLVLVIAVGLLTGCGEEEKPDNVVTWLTTMDNSPDNERIHKMFNEKLKAKTGCTVEFVSIDQSQYDLRLASNEEFDLIYAPDHSGYWTNVAKDAFMPITEAEFKKYAPDIWALGKEQLDIAKYNGKYYAVPAIGDSWAADRIYAARGDLMDKVGVESLNTIEDIDRYLMGVAELNKKGETNIVPYNTNGGTGYMIFVMFAADWGWANPGSLSYASHYYYDMFDPSYKLFKGIDTPQVKQYSDTVKKWYDAGVFSKSVLSSNESSEEQFRKGKSALAWIGSPALGNVLLNDLKKMPEAKDWDVRLYSIYEKYQRAFNYINYGTAIGRNSKNKKNALKVLNAVLTDEELYNLIQYGEKGVHYEITEAGYTPLKVSEKKTYTPPYVSIRNTNFDHKTKYDYAYAEDLVKELKNKTVNDPFVNCPILSSNDTDMQVKFTQLNDVYLEVSMARLYGAVDNVDAAIAKEKKALKDAGIDEYMKYVQRQMDAYKDSHSDAMKEFEANKKAVTEYLKANPNKTNPKDY